MRTSATSDTAATKAATVQGSVRLRNGSLARLNLAITYSFAFRRECGCGGGPSGDFTDDEKNNPRESQKAKGKGQKTEGWKRHAPPRFRTPTLPPDTYTPHILPGCKTVPRA